ncbi:MAG: hypothetical protein ABWY34_11150 [Pseudoxanthomonas sp.]
MLVLVSCDAFASTNADHAQEIAMRDYLQRLASALVSRGDARSLALASIIGESEATRSWMDGKSMMFVESKDGPHDASGLRHSALASAGDDVLVYVLLLSGTSESGRQSRADAAARWAQLETDNLAPALALGSGVEVLPPTLDTYGRMDLHYVEQLRWIVDSVLADPPTSAEAKALYVGQVNTADKFASLLATGLWAMTSLPFGELVRSCKGEALHAEDSRRERCRRVAGVLSENSDTLLGRAIGLAMQANVAEEGERPLIAERRRRHDWQMTQWALISAENETKNSNEFLRRVEDPRNSSEIDVMDMMLAEAGIPSAPPAGWKSERALP